MPLRTRRRHAADSPAHGRDDVIELFREDFARDRLVAALADELLDHFSRRSDVSPPTDHSRLWQRFCDTRLPERPSTVDAYVHYLDEVVAAESTRGASPRCLAFMTTSPPSFMPQIARLVTALNQNLVRLDASRALTYLERQTLAMLHRLVFAAPDAFYEHHTQCQTSTLGIMVSGGTLANVAGLWCARNARLGTADGVVTAQREGLPNALSAHGYKDAAILASSSAHYSISKAADLLGLGSRHLIQVATDSQDRLDLTDLRSRVRTLRAAGTCVLAIVGVAGATQSGAIDPLRDMALIAREANAHFHVDASWGAPLMFSPRHRQRLAGIELADSVAVDGHKQLYTPTGTGVLLLRDPALARGIEQHANYIIRNGSSDLGRYSLEGSRPGHSVFLHAALHVMGRRGYARLIERSLSQARYAATSIAGRNEFELLLRPELNIVLYRVLPTALAAARRTRSLTPAELDRINRLNLRIHETQWARGRSLVSRTTLTTPAHLSGTVALRAIFANPKTTRQHIDEVLDEQTAIGGEVSADIAGP
jgi:glutamate decarboxylase